MPLTAMVRRLLAESIRADVSAMEADGVECVAIIVPPVVERYVRDVADELDVAVVVSDDVTGFMVIGHSPHDTATDE